MANRIELCGRVANPPALRVTPAGTPVLSLIVDCGEKPGELLMPVVMAGETARTLASRLSQGGEVRACGSIRRAHSRVRAGASGSGVEVVADEITPADARV